MTKRLVYLIGLPGSGKSTALHGAIGLLDWRRDLIMTPFAHEYLRDGDDRKALYLGRRREAFSGTDALAMGVQPVVLDFLRTGQPRTDLIIGEGDRLGNAAFFAAAERLGYLVDVVLMDVSDSLAEQRRQARGSTQNSTWLKGRATKTRNLAPRCRHVLPGQRAPDELAALLAQIITSP